MNIDLDSDAAFGVPHFLMMGMNEGRGGVYSEEDVAYSESFVTVKERNAANIAAWLDRLRDMGPVRVSKHILRKSLSAFSDGTFAWEIEGGFYVDVTGYSSALKTWYGIGEVGSEWGNGLAYSLLCQAIWIAILFGCALGATHIPQGNDLYLHVMRLVLLMLALYLMVFEVRARYLLIYAPWFVMLGVAGWFRITGTIRRSLVALCQQGACADYSEHS